MSDLFMVFDVESIGLHGEGFAVGYVVVNRQGERLEERVLSCDPEEAQGSSEGHAWVSENVPALPFVFPKQRLMRDAFWARWLYWKDLGAVLVADCCWPVEARFLIACVDDDRSGREWEGPYPLHDLASVLLANGANPLAVTERHCWRTGPTRWL